MEQIENEEWNKDLNQIIYAESLNINSINTTVKIQILSDWIGKRNYKRCNFKYKDLEIVKVKKWKNILSKI